MRKIDFQKTILAATNLALSEALSDALFALSEFLGRKDMKWLDELEAQFINDIKNSHMEGVSGEAEIKVMNGTLALFGVIMDDARTRITDAAKDD